MSFGRFLLKRLLQGVVVVWGVITVVFLLRFITPGSPVDVVAPLDASAELRRQIARELGVNQPLYVQYTEYLLGVVQGDWGYSYISRTEASARVFARLPATVELAASATVVAVVLSIPLGVVSATRRNQPADYGATTFSLLGISTPNFWLGIMLILLLGVQFEVFPVGGRGVGFLPALGMLLVGNPGGIVNWLAHITLPAITLGTYFTALITRLTRSGMLDQLGRSYVRATRAKGLPETLVRYRHVLRNTLIPVVTVVGLQMGTLIGGAVITEAVFDWPGLGTTVINSINQRDWPVLQGALIVIGVGFVVVNIAVDALYAYLNPRVVE
ncbi:ABC transporter permease [Halomarina litorea]|uniref:ABC transporter permease n=1 Tax=Halomarina litorea TaxID=2961595 RepID=UPI0020C4FC34|nr:ABC transporter permease [Halomarina sp. BCD28]